MTFSFDRASRKLTEALGMLEEMRKKDDDLNSKEYFTEANPESFFLMPETCSLVEEIIIRRVDQVIDSYGILLLKQKQESWENWQLAEEWEEKRNSLREEFIGEIKSKVTYPFRRVLNQALEEKHSALDTLKSIAKLSVQSVISNRMRRPPREESTSSSSIMNDDEDEE